METAHHCGKKCEPPGATGATRRRPPGGGEGLRLVCLHLDAVRGDSKADVMALVVHSKGHQTRALRQARVQNELVDRRWQTGERRPVPSTRNTRRRRIARRRSRSS